jgi:hypothetical protein
LTTVAKSTKVRKALKRSYGYLFLPVIAYARFGTDKIGAGAIAILSAALVVYGLFQAPVWCGAETRNNERCCNNAYGLLMGCYLRQHRWQRLKMAMQFHSWRRLFGRMMSGFGGQAAAIGALTGTISTLVALASFAVGK